MMTIVEVVKYVRPEDDEYAYQSAMLFFWVKGTNLSSAELSDSVALLIPGVLADLGVPFTGCEWSLKAGCGCGCSPGFLLNGDFGCGFDVHLDLAM